MKKSDKYRVMSGALAATMLSSAFSGISAFAENTDQSTSKPESEPVMDTDAVKPETNGADAAMLDEEQKDDISLGGVLSDAVNQFVMMTMSADDEADREAANAVKQLIEDLSSETADMSAENYTAYYEQIKVVRAEYDALSYYGKAAVGNASLQVLTSTESKYDTLAQSDIDNLKNTIDTLEALDADNYLAMSADFVAARELCKAFEERQQVLSEGNADAVAEYNRVMEATNDARAKLTEMVDTVSGYIKTTMEDFKAAVITDLDFSITELATGETLDIGYETDAHLYLTRFVSSDDYDKFNSIEAYIEVAVEKYEAIRNSALYADFLEDDEFKSLVVDYLKNYYKYKTDQLKLIYGEPDSLGENIRNIDLWDNGTKEILFTYLEKQRVNTDNALDAVKVLQGDVEELADYKNYCSRLFEAMNIAIGDEIDKFVEKVLPLIGEENVNPSHNYNENDIAGKECIELDFAEDAIRMVDEARNADRNFDISIQQYLREYDTPRYNKLFDVNSDPNTPVPVMNSIILEGMNQLKEAAGEELAKYDTLKTAIAEYNLTYKSGFESKFGESEDTDPDAFIADIKEQMVAIKKAELTLYYDKFASSNDVAVLNSKLTELQAAIDAFDKKLDDIKALRTSSKSALEAYDAFEEYFGYNYMEEQKNRYNGFAKHEDVVDFIDTFIEEYNATHSGETVSLDEVMSKFDAMTESRSEYINKADVYAATYTSDDFSHPADINREQPYMSQPEMDEVDKLAKVIYRHTDMTEFMAKVGEVYDNTITLPENKEEHYNKHDGFAKVAEVKSAYAALAEEYKNMSIEQKYCVKRDTEKQLNSMAVEFEAWEKAIDVMDKIDAINDTEDWNEYINLVKAANDAYVEIEGDAAITSKIADSARTMLDFAVRFAALFEDIIDVPVIVSQHQIDGRYADPNYEVVVADLRTRFDALVTENYASINTFVTMAKQTLEAREYEVACAVKARSTDMEINDLDKYDPSNFEDEENGFYAYIDAFTEVENTITDLINEDAVEGRPANMTFGMLLQYSKFTHHRELIDKMLVDVFVHSVDLIGDIDYTSDFDEKKSAIGVADNLYDNLLNNRQRSTAEAQAAKTKLEELRVQLAKCMKAMQDAQGAIAKLSELEDALNIIYAEVHKPSREAMYADIAMKIGEYDEYICSLKDAADDMAYAYEYLDANGYIALGDMDKAQFMDRFFYYSVQKDIDDLWETAQNAKDDETLLSSIDVKNIEDEYRALAEFEYMWDTGKNQQEMVENYSKLAWIRQIINDNEDAYIKELQEYMDETGLMDEDVTPSTFSISLKDNIIYASELYNAMSDTVKSNVDSAYSAKLLVLADALEELEKAIATGKKGDVNQDGRITIADIVNIVDFALDNDIVPETTVQFVRADIDESNEIDVNDVIEAIDLIEF